MTPSFPDRIRAMVSGFQPARIVLLGIELELFEQLLTPHSAPEVAERIGATERGTEIVLDALTALGFVTKKAGRYTNTPDTARYLVRGTPDSMANILAHNAKMFHSWAALDDIMRNGHAVEEHEKDTLADPATNRSFILGMAEVTRGRVGPVLDALQLDDVAHFVDMGGGPAQYSCEAVRRHPAMRATLVDLPLTVAVAREYIAGQGLSDRVATQVCDFYRADSIELASPPDLVFVSQVLHAEGAVENQALLRKVAHTVPRGGRIVVHENLAAADRTAPLPAAIFAVNMLAGTCRGRTYTEAEIASWLSQAGLEPEPAVKLQERSWLIQARKP